MIRLHQHLALFTGILTVLFVATGTLIYKFGPLFLHQTIYYCQELMASFFTSMPKTLLFLGGTVTIIRLVYVLAGVYFFRIKLSGKYVFSNVAAELANKLNLSGKISVFAEPRPLAFCLGTFRPRIYLSTGLLRLVNCRELEAVLRHEKYHLDHRDGLTHLIASITLSLFPHFPVFADLIKRYRIQREINADRAVVEAMNGSGFLLSVIRKFLQRGPAAVPAFTPALAEWETLELRIKSLISRPIIFPKLPLVKVWLSLASAAVMLGLLIAPLKAVELHSQRQDVAVLCLAE